MGRIVANRQRVGEENRIEVALSLLLVFSKTLA